MAPIRAGFLLFALLASGSNAQTCGDCDSSGSVSITDALRAAQLGAGIVPQSPADLPRCDVDDTTVVTVLDSLLIAQTAVGFAPALRCPGTPPNAPPTASAITLPATPFGEIAIDYVLADAEANTCSIMVCVSLDGGSTYPIVATEGTGGDGRGFLGSSPGGTPRVFVWDSLTDLGSGITGNVVVRITPSDPVPGTSAESTAVTIDNTSLDQPPAVTNVRFLGTVPFGGDVTLEYALADFESDPCDILVEVSTNGGVTFPILATDGAGGDGRTGLLTNPVGFIHQYVWDSQADLGAILQTDVVLRITPSDSLATGSPGTSVRQVIDNRPPNTPPRVSAVVPQPPLAGDLAVTYQLQDAESDPAQVVVEFSTDGGTTFPLVATDGPGGDGRVGLASSPGGTAHTYVWASATDLGAVVTPNVVVRITPMDALPGTAGSTAPFTVDNVVIVSYALDLEPTILDTTPGGMGCLACHGTTFPAGGLDLSSYASLMAGGFSGPSVLPGNPGSSRMICKLEGSACGSRMPRGGTPWTPAMVQTFRDWIAQGAQDN